MATPVQAVPSQKSSPCIARQPILTADETVIGYELFFRESQEQKNFSADAESATSATIDMLNFVGLGVLCDGRLAFINCTHQMLLSDYFALLPPSDVVIEIQETVPADQNVVEACQRLKQTGYSIALDNFAPGDKREALVPFARFIKVDTNRVPSEDCAALAGRFTRPDCLMLAQKVESRDQFVIARNNGFARFQGYFFRRPENLRARQI